MPNEPVKEQGKTKRLPATGFHTNPERINKKGAPEKPWTWRQLIVDSLEEVEEGTGFEYRKVAVRKLREKATSGDIAALKEIGDRVDGRAPQETNLNVRNIGVRS